MSTQPKLVVGLADFEKPTLLLLGSVGSLTWLAGQIEQRHEVRMSDGRLPILLKNIDVHMIPVAECGTLQKVDHILRWNISPTDAVKFSQELRSLAMSGKPAHVYLDTQSEIEVIASLDEYDPGNAFS